MEMVWNIFFALGGVAVMMMGMRSMIGGLEKFAGGNMKTLLGKITNNRFAGVGVGMVVTAIIQSSTATSVMLVGFVNVGLMTLTQAASVIMGANIGTTITAHIVSLSGVGGAVNVGAIAAIIGFIGVLLAMLVKNDKLQNMGSILAGLGLMFVGLEFISTYATQIMFVDGDKNVPREFVRLIFQKDHFPLLLILIGLVLTALVHSSATITSLMVVLASIGVLSFQNALFLALGSNIGTCVTSVVSSAGMSVNAKRTAIVHFLFNVFGCLLFTAPLWIWGDWVTALFARMSGDVGQQIAIFHTIFNVATTIVLLPFSQCIVKLSTLIIPDKKGNEGDELQLQFIGDLMLQSPVVAVCSLEKEIIRMANVSKENIGLSMDMLLHGNDNSKEIYSNEQLLNFLNKNITRYLTALMGEEMPEKEEKKVGSFYHVVSDIERVGDYCINIIEYAEKLRGEDTDLSDGAKAELTAMKERVIELFDVSIAAFEKRDQNLLPEIDTIEQSIDEMNFSLEEKHIDRLKTGACSAQVGSVYLQTISNLERVGDHICNVAFSISPKSKH